MDCFMVDFEIVEMYEVCVVVYCVKIDEFKVIFNYVVFYEMFIGECMQCFLCKF